MKTTRHLVLLAVAECFVVTSCAQGVRTETFVACTPCDEAVRRINRISPGADCDLIRWKLTLAGNSEYTLDNEWGFYVDNATYEKRGQLQTRGKYELRPVPGNVPGSRVYHLNPGTPASELSLLEVNGNVLHVMVSGQELLPGNGGWSYALNNIHPRNDIRSSPGRYDASQYPVPDGDSLFVFQGRTPCFELADKLGIPQEENCFKLKWLLTLHLDPATHMPTTYELSRTFHRQSIITGKWTMLKGAQGYPEAVVYQLDPDKPEQSLMFMRGDGNVLFFLDENRNLLTGNGEFSYTLNRRKN